MFYLKEIYLRIFYFIFTFLFLLIIFYNYRYLIIIYLTLPVFSSEAINHLSYPDPSKMLTLYLYIIFIFSFILIVPFILFQLLDFLKSSFTKKEYQKNKTIFIFFLIGFFIVNLLAFHKIIPIFWNYLGDFGNSTRIIKSFNIFLELRIDYYFQFLFTYWILINIFFLFFTIITYIILNTGIVTLFSFRKVFILINIFSSTFLTPPDVYSQLFLLFTLQLFFEFLIFLSILKFKLQKFLSIF